MTGNNKQEKDIDQFDASDCEKYGHFIVLDSGTCPVCKRMIA
jgi:hypothetical protein